MPETDRPLPVDDRMLAEVTASMVSFHERYYGRTPAAAQSRMMDGDLLACVFGGLYTDVEKTLIELSSAGLVREGRTAFERAMEPRLVGEVERITGRVVERFISGHHVGPDVGVGLFVLGAPTPSSPR